MPRVVSLTDLVPPARYDGVAWTGAIVEEAATPDGPSTVWTQIDTQQAIAPPDADPTAPAPRSVTTALAQLSTGWYRLVFTDPSGGLSEPSFEIRSSIDSNLPPAPMDIRNASPLLRAKVPIPTVDAYALSDLRNMVYTATMYVQAMTWRLIDTTLGCPAPAEEGYTCELVPNEMVPMVVQVITKLVERYNVLSSVQYATQVATGRRLRGFTAGPYSENYFDPGQFSRRGVMTRPVMDNDDTIDGLLWALATEDARDYFVWRTTGVGLPTGVSTSFDYRRQSLGYGAGSWGGAGGGLAHGGPDGY
jgi:hypothetical protein